MNLHGKREKTDADGHFTFGCIQPGTYNLVADFLPNSYVPISRNYSPITVAGGKENKTTLLAVRAGKISGRVIQQGVKKMHHGDEVKVSPGESLVEESDVFYDFRDVGGIKNVQVILRKEDFSEIYSQLTDDEGNFNFPQLRPGKWHVTIHIDKSFETMTLDANESDLSLSPGEERSISFYMRPKIHKIRKFD
jgi:hypothetical protein